MFDSEVILWGEITRWSAFGVKGLKHRNGLILNGKNCKLEQEASNKFVGFIANILQGFI